MAAHEAKACPRCGQPFECKPGNVTECQCFGLSFSEPEKEYIGAVSDDCLCRSCLLALRQEYHYGATRSRLEQMQSIIRSAQA